MPQMVIKLMGESQSLISASSAGRNSVGQLDRSLDSLISTMEREQTVTSQSARQTQILALADKGASLAKVEYALALAGELDALESLTAAEAVEAKKKQEQERATERATVARKAHRDALDMEYQSMLLMAGIATVGGAPVRTNALGGVSQNHQQLASFTAAFPGRTNMQDNIVMLQQQGYHEARVTRGIQLRNEAQARLNQTQGIGGQASRTNMLAIQALAFGVQDAAQVYGNTGLAGAISASANNLIFMTSILSPQLAIFTAIAVAGGQFAAVLLPMAFNAKKVGEETKRLTAIYREHSDILVTMAQKRREFAYAVEDATSREGAGSLVKQTEREGKNLAGEMAARQQAIADLEKRRASAAEKETTARMTQTTLGRAGEMVGATAVAGVGEQKDINKLIAEERLKLTELRNEMKLNQQQLTAAREQARKAEEQHFLASDSKERVRQKEEQNRQESELLNRQNEERAKKQEQYVKDRAQLEKTTAEQLRTEDQNKRAEILQTLGEQQQQIEGWLSEGRISAADAMGLRMQARQAAGRSLMQQEQQARLGPIEERLKTNKKLLEDQTGDPGNQNLTAVEANSAAGMKQIFDAMGGGTDPQQMIAKNTQEMATSLKTWIVKAEGIVDAIKKNKPIKTGGS